MMQTTHPFSNPTLETKLGDNRFNGGFDRSVLIPQGKVFVGGLSHDTTDSSLRRFFERFGEVLNAEVLRDHHTLNSRGFGFVTFLHDTVARDVVRIGKICPHTLDNKQVEVKVAVPKGKETKENVGYGSKRDSWRKQASASAYNKENKSRGGINRSQHRLKHQRTASISTASSITSTEPMPIGYQGGNPHQPPYQRAHSLNVLSIAEEEPFVDLGLGYLPANMEQTGWNRIARTSSDNFYYHQDGKERSPTSTSSYSSASLYSGSVPPYQRVHSMPLIGGEFNVEKSQFVEKNNNNLVPNKIFVGGLLYATGHESLRKFFECFGEVESAEVIYNRDTKKSRGFGFVVFRDFNAVQRVIIKQQVQRLTIDGKQIEVKLCKAREDVGSGSENVNINESNGRSRSDLAYINNFHEPAYGAMACGLDSLTALESYGDYESFGAVGAHLSPISKLNRSSVPYIPQNKSSRLSRWAALAEKPKRTNERYDNFNFKYNINSLLPRISELELN